MKKLSLVLVMILLCSVVCSPIQSAYAMSNSEEMTIYEYAEKLAEEHPQWEVRVVNDTLHIVNHENDDENSLMTLSNVVEGGTYTNFIPPLFYPSTSIIPYRIYLVPASLSELLYIAKNDENLFKEILDAIVDASANVIQQVLDSNYEMSISYEMALFLTGVIIIDGFLWIDTISFNMAYDINGNLKITKYTLDGWPAVMYESWNGTVISPYPYENFNPQFHQGIYDELYVV